MTAETRQRSLARLVSHRPVTGPVVAILGNLLPDRSLELIPQPIRAICQGQIHQLIVTREEVGPASTVKSFTYLGFFEVRQGGVAVVGDDVRVHGWVVGELAGFDTSHLPDHLNLVVKSKLPPGQVVWRFHLGDEVFIGQQR